MKTNVEKLMELKQLYEAGILTKEEMEEEKKKIIADKNYIEDKKTNQHQEEKTNDVVIIDNVNNKKLSLFKRKKKIILGIVAAIIIAWGGYIISMLFLNSDIEKDKEDKTENVQGIYDDYQEQKYREDEIKKNRIKMIDEFYKENKKKGNVSLEKFLRNDEIKKIIIDKFCPSYYNAVMALIKKNGEIGNIELTSDGIYKGHANIYPRATGVDPYDDWAVDFSYNPTYDQLELKATVFDIPLKSDGSVNEDRIKKEIERLNEEARKKEASEIEAIESQAISIGKVIDAYNNNIDGRADNIFYKKEKVYQFKIKTIRKSNSDYEYVMEGYGFGERSNNGGRHFYVYTDDNRLTELNFPVTICFRGYLVSIENDGVTSTYHFICNEALTYNY